MGAIFGTARPTGKLLRGYLIWLYPFNLTPWKHNLKAKRNCQWFLKQTLNFEQTLLKSGLWRNLPKCFYANFRFVQDCHLNMIFLLFADCNWGRRAEGTPYTPYIATALLTDKGYRTISGVHIQKPLWTIRQVAVHGESNHIKIGLQGTITG